MADLEQGPCSEQFSNLEACAAEKKSKNPQARIDNPKAKVVPRVIAELLDYCLLPTAHTLSLVSSDIIPTQMLFCPRQTDELIKCIKKHPKTFQQQQRQG